MSTQFTIDTARSRLTRALGEYLYKAACAQIEGQDTAEERWALVAQQIDLLIAQALLDASAPEPR